MTTPPGWYHDPGTPGSLRYYDGTAWTPHVAPVPPPASAYGSTVVAAPWAPAAPGSRPDDALHWVLPTGRTWQSIAAGYVALFAIVLWFLGPVALWLGIAGLRASARTGEHGRGRAWFAVIVGALASVGLLAILGLLLG